MPRATKAFMIGNLMFPWMFFCCPYTQAGIHATPLETGSEKHTLYKENAALACSCCAVAAMMWSFLGWGKGIIPQGAIRPQPEGGESGEEVRGFRSGGYMVAEGGGNGGSTGCLNVSKLTFY